MRCRLSNQTTEIYTPETVRRVSELVRDNSLFIQSTSKWERPRSACVLGQFWNVFRFTFSYWTGYIILRNLPFILSTVVNVYEYKIFGVCNFFDRTSFFLLVKCISVFTWGRNGLVQDLHDSRLQIAAQGGNKVTEFCPSRGWMSTRRTGKIQVYEIW